MKYCNAPSENYTKINSKKNDKIIVYSTTKYSGLKEDRIENYDKCSVLHITHCLVEETFNLHFPQVRVPRVFYSASSCSI